MIYSPTYSTQKICFSSKEMNDIIASGIVFLFLSGERSSKDSNMEHRLNLVHFLFLFSIFSITGKLIEKELNYIDLTNIFHVAVRLFSNRTVRKIP